MEQRQISKPVEELAKAVIDEYEELQYIKFSNVKIAYLESDYTKKDKGGVVYGVCEKVLSKNKWAIDYDFTITLYSCHVAGMTSEQIKILLFHELLHVGIEVDDNGDEVYSIRPHDLEDFKLIIEKFGVNWADNQLELQFA